MSFKSSILLVLIFIGLYSCKSSTKQAEAPGQPALSGEVKRLSDAIAEDNVLKGSAVGIAGERPAQWDRFMQLSKAATGKELVALTSHPNAVVRCYAFDALSKRPDIDPFPILLRHLSDTAPVSTLYGCLGGKEKAGDIFLEVLTTGMEGSPRYKLSQSQKATLDSILLFDKNISLRSKTNMLAALPPESKYYDRLREMVTVEQNMDALIP